MKKRVFGVLGIIVLVIGTILTVLIVNYNDPENREARNKKYYIEHVNERLGISVSVSDVQFGPCFYAFQDWDDRVELFIADDAETVEKALEEAGWLHEPLPNAFLRERMFDRNTYDVQLRGLVAHNDYWWFYRDDYYARYGKKSNLNPLYEFYSFDFTYAFYFPELNTLYYREHNS